ncbi:MAG: tetratricopeptide repeat protein [Elusimicrobiota bacterium]
MGKTLKIIVSVSLVLLAVLFLITKVIEYDVWLHLSSGKYICANFKVPHLDPFSYTASHREYVDSHWLYQVFLYLFYKLAGFFGLFLYQLLIIGTIFYILFRMVKKSNFYVMNACILLTLLIANNRFLYRPEMFSYLFAVLFILILDKCSSTPLACITVNGSNPRGCNYKSIFLLPALQILWVNTHGFFIFGPIIIGCYFIGELIQGRRHLSAVYPILLILSVLACFINPYGYKLVAYPFLLLTEIGSKASPYMKTITELTPILFTEKGNYRTVAYFILIAVSFASFFVAKKFNFSRFFVFLLFVYLSWITERNIVFFAFVSSLITILNFTEIKDIKILRGNRQLIADYIYPVLMIIVSVFVSVGVITNRYYRQEKTMQQFGIGMVNILFPVNAVEFIKTNNITGNIFNDALIGGYFIWNCWPERKCFVDGKMEIYGEEFLQGYKNTIDNPNVYWQKIADKYKIDYVLLHPLSPHSKNIMKYLYKNNPESSSGWQLVFFDESGIVFVKGSRRLNADYIIKEPSLGSYSKLNKSIALFSYANFYFFTEQYQKAQNYYMEVLKYEPNRVEAYINLGAMFLMQKKYEQAKGCYLAAIRITRKYAEPYYGLAMVDVEKGKYKSALEILHIALRKKPVFLEAQFLLCYVYLKLWQFDNVINECNRILTRTPSDEKIYNLLGTAYFYKKEYDNATEYYKKALEINPDFDEARHNYEACLDKMREK